MRTQGQDVLDDIRTTKDLSAETSAKLDKALEDFTAVFLADKR